MPVRALGSAAALFIALGLTAAAAAQPAKGAAANGEVLFRQNCAACHQAAGQGIRGAFPALAGNAFVQGNPRPVAAVLLNGRGSMPNFRGNLSNEQIAAVLTFVRSAWGNHAPPVTAATVANLQGSSVRPRGSTP